MISDLSIIGCGQIGSKLAFKLSKKRIISSLKIYDFDKITTYSEKNEYENNLFKVDVVEFECKKVHPDLSISVYHTKVVDPVKSGFVVDCRDNKKTSLNSNLRVSIDGYVLYLDSLKKYISSNYFLYTLPKNEIYTDRAIDIIIDYLYNDLFYFNDMRLYNLETAELFTWRN